MLDFNYTKNGAGKMKYSVQSLQHEAIDKCFNSKSVKHMDIMKDMIEKAYHEGRKQGQREMAYESRQRISSLIPNELDY